MYEDLNYRADWVLGSSLSPLGPCPSPILIPLVNSTVRPDPTNTVVGHDRKKENEREVAKDDLDSSSSLCSH